MRKRTISILLAALVLAGLMSACGRVSEPEGNGEGERKLSIVATIFPEYDWVMNVLGERAKDVDVTLLLDSGVDLHSYQPTADDMIRVSGCDLFICVGGVSDKWVADALKTAVNKDMIVLNLMELLGDAVREEEVVEGMEAEHEEEEEAEDEPEYDEHVWLSLNNAAVLCGAIRDALCALDAEHAEEYTANTEAYLDKLAALDGEYRAVVDGAPLDVVLFGDRFPFRYLTDDYGLTYYAAFVGCSAETEASFETVTFLAGKVRELGLPVILTLEGTDHRLAETVAGASGVQGVAILAMNSMQSVTMKDVRAGADYLNIMERNLNVLGQALGQYATVRE